MDRNEAIEVLKDFWSVYAVGTEIREAFETLIPELKENEDEKIRKELIQYLKDYPNLPNGNYCRDDFFAWLEKQGEQKPANNIVAIWKDMRFEVGAQASGNRHEPQYSDNSTKLFSLNDIDEIIEKISEKQGEQKSVDMAKPKFKVGDWVISDESHHGYHICQIIGIDDNKYFIESIEGYTNFKYFSAFEKLYHLWTIQDAKDGDVLNFDCGIGIFKNLSSDGYNAHCYCYYDRNGQLETYERGLYLYDIYKAEPATKEQRDLLFQKMKEAGYEWDAEKKELRKIEQNHAWSEEDEQYLLVCKNALAKYQTTDKWDAGIISHWLEDKFKSLKDRVRSLQDLHPRYIEGKGIYVPIIDVVLNMQDEPRVMTWDEAKDIALSKEQMFVVLYYRDEINALLEKHGGQKLEGLHWTSTQYSSASNTWSVSFHLSDVLSIARGSSLRVRAFSAYHHES